MALYGRQKKLDADGDNKITGNDFRMLRTRPKVKGIKFTAKKKKNGKKEKLG